jgi:hypothetical protein
MLAARITHHYPSVSRTAGTFVPAWQRCVIRPTANLKTKSAKDLIGQVFLLLVVIDAQR